jgi:hypothetical protein
MASWCEQPLLARGVAAIALLVAATGFTETVSPIATPTPVPTPPPSARAVSTPTATPTPATPTPTPVPTNVPAEASSLPCREVVFGHERILDATRRRLYQTLCSAALWLDGLFGRHGSVTAAEGVTGRAELSVLRSNVEGTKIKTGLDVNAALPHLEQKLHAFLGRSDPNDYIRDRQEGFGLRSQFVSLETEEKWLGGLGYSLPGSLGNHFGLRAGIAGGINATLFGQAIYRTNIPRGERDLWHLREVGFWRSREGFGLTSSADWDHVVSDTMLLRWGSIGTVSQGTHGLDWRTALVLYQNLHNTRAMAYEVFIRGQTGTLGLTEYGPRLIYRQSAFRPWFFVDALTGYSWLRLNPREPHQGSVVYGLGCELWFGPATE